MPHLNRKHLFRSLKKIRQDQITKLIINLKDKRITQNNFVSTAFSIVQKQFNQMQSTELKLGNTGLMLSIYIRYHDKFEFKFKIASFAQCKDFCLTYKASTFENLSIENLGNLVFTNIFSDQRNYQSQEKKGTILFRNNRILIQYAFAKRNKSRHLRKMKRKAVFLKRKYLQNLQQQDNSKKYSQQDLQIQSDYKFVDNLRNALNDLQQDFQVLTDQIVLLKLYMQSIGKIEVNQKNDKPLILQFQLNKNQDKDMRQKLFLNLKHVGLLSNNIKQICDRLQNILKVKETQQKYSSQEHFSTEEQSFQAQKISQIKQLDQIYFFHLSFFQKEYFTEIFISEPADS